jgi:hypothetical protein
MIRIGTLPGSGVDDNGDAVYWPESEAHAVATISQSLRLNTVSRASGNSSG